MSTIDQTRADQFEAVRADAGGMRMLNDIHVSVDIEACGEVLLSIGACSFDPTSGRSISEFSGVPSVEDQLRVGLAMDAGAFAWLMKQPDATRSALSVTDPAEVVLSRFRSWLRLDAWVWAYPTSFDLPVIERVCRKFGVRPPWKWTKTMDGRTLWQLACSVDPAMKRIEESANPSPHHALEDAKEQARWFSKYLAPLLAHSARPRLRPASSAQPPEEPGQSSTQ